MGKLIKLVLFGCCCVATEGLSYLVISLVRGDSYYRLGWVWYSDRVLGWAVAVVLAAPLWGGICGWLARRKIIDRRLTKNQLLRLRIQLEMAGLWVERVDRTLPRSR